jgi:hypothetical protein
MTFKLGEQVEWGTGGAVNIHSGEVTKIIGRGEFYTNDSYSPRCRNHESYEVTEVIKKRKPKKYWPLVKNLRRVGA